MQYYEAPYAPAPVPMQAPLPPTSKAKGLAIAALIVGIASLVLCWIPFLGLLGGIVAIVLGVIALVKAQSKGMSITGIATGTVALLTGIALTIAAFALFGFIGAQLEGSGPVAGSTVAPEAPQPDQGQNQGSGYSEDIGTDVGEILQIICDEHQICTTEDEQPPTYSPEYCASIKDFYGVGTGDQLQKATALGQYDDYHARYWKYAAELMADPSSGEISEAMSKIITELYFRGYQNCNFVE